MKKKRILFVMSSLYNGGAEKSLVNLLNELPPNKYNVDLMLFRNEGMFLKQVPSYVNVIEAPEGLIKLYGSLTKAGRYLVPKFFGTLVAKAAKRGRIEQTAFRWKHFYKKCSGSLRQRYDVAIAYMHGEPAYFVGDNVNSGRKLMWVHIDYREAKLPKKSYYPYLRKMNGIVSISQSCVDILKEEFPDLSDKIYCIENITSSTVTRNRAQEFYPSEYVKDKPIILSIGRLTEQKGFDIAIDAAKLLKDRGICFQWYVIGNGDLEAALEKQIAENDLKDCFKLLGTRENPYPYISNCTVFAQTSRFEGKSVVLDEAKILCKPIIVTNYPTVKDQIEDGKEGIIVPMNPEGIADGIERMLTDTLLRKKTEKYLTDHEYGNQDEVKKYMALIDA